jgi:hypothetical protein
LEKDRAHVGRGAVAIVAERLDDQGNPARAETLIADLLIIGGIAHRALVDRALDIVLGMDCALAAITAARSRGFMSGSGVPILAATVISRESLENIAERFLSCAPCGA